jgi:hypothetical protein
MKYDRKKMTINMCSKISWLNSNLKWCHGKPKTLKYCMTSNCTILKQGIDIIVFIICSIPSMNISSGIKDPIGIHVKGVGWVHDFGWTRHVR